MNFIIELQKEYSCLKLTVPQPCRPVIDPIYYLGDIDNLDELDELIDLPILNKSL